MPYIPQKDRDRLSEHEYSGATTPGELNYIFTKEIIAYINIRGLSYQTINDVLGALEGAKLEFLRRRVNKYEDNAIKRNGDVY